MGWFMKVCVVVLNYNDYSRTIKFIEEIKDFKSINDIIVVDNNSIDNSYKYLKEYENNKITVLANKQNKGYGAGNNFGCKYAIDKYTNPIIFISNPDIVVKEKVFIEIIKTLKRQDDLALAAPKINQDGLYEMGWKLTSPIKGALMYLPFVYKIMRKIKTHTYYYPDSHYIRNESYVDVVTGCFFAIKGNIFKKIDFFDENIFLYNEEEVLARKLKEFGYKTLLMNNLEVVHEHSVSINKSFSAIKKILISNRSKIYYQKLYNKANKFELFIWYLVNQITIVKNIILVVFKKISGGKKYEKQ